MEGRNGKYQMMENCKWYLEQYDANLEQIQG